MEQSVRFTMPGIKRYIDFYQVLLAFVYCMTYGETFKIAFFQRLSSLLQNA